MRKQNATAEEKVTAAEAKATAAEESAKDAQRRAKAAEVQTTPNILQLAKFITGTDLTAYLFMSSGTSRDSQVRAWCAQRSRTTGEKTAYLPSLDYRIERLFRTLYNTCARGHTHAHARTHTHTQTHKTPYLPAGGRRKKNT